MKTGLYILGDGRKAYLEFLRNLTPQIFIITMIIIAGSKLDWSHISFSNPVGTFFFWTLIILFFTAAWANGAEFLVKAIEHFQEQAKNKREDFHSLSPMQQIIYAIRHHSWLFIQMLLTMFLVEVGLASVAIMGIENGKRLLPLLGH